MTRDERNRIDDWMVDELNHILNKERPLSEDITIRLSKAIGEISCVMMLANRRKKADGTFDTYFDDDARSRYSVSNGSRKAEKKETVCRVSVQP